MKYAFVDYENEADAAEAVKDINGKDMEGLKINIGKSLLFIY
jgi:RNA recognition motif-containing protein